MITREELAKELNVSRATISKNEARGMPTDDVQRARRWRKKHIQPGRMKGVRRDTLSGDGVQTPAPVPPDSDDGDDRDDLDPEDAKIRSYVGARDRREHYQAELARLTYEREAGMLMVSSDVIKLVSEVGVDIRLTLEAMPHRLSPILADMTDELKISQVLDQEVFKVLTEMSQKFERLASKHFTAPRQPEASTQTGIHSDFAEGEQ